jgi:hypothetical protein
MGTASTGTVLPIKKEAIKGVIAAASRVDTAVMETERATSALAMYAMTLLAVPPGQHATRIRPTA